MKYTFPPMIKILPCEKIWTVVSILQYSPTYKISQWKHQLIAREAQFRAVCLKINLHLNVDMYLLFLKVIPKKADNYSCFMLCKPFSCVRLVKLLRSFVSFTIYQSQTASS